MSTVDWLGARWWKIDFHAHTPASSDYGKGPDAGALKQRGPRAWLLDYMRAGIDAVAVTDHNSGAWIDALKDELKALFAEKPEGFRPLVLFPGVELSVNGGVHLLALFDPTKTTGDVDGLLGRVGYEGTKGASDEVTTKSLTDVVDAIVSCGGLPIPAHVDGPSGLFEKLTGNSLKQVLNHPQLFTMEVVEANPQPPQLFKEHLSKNWTMVLGADAHHPSELNLVVAGMRCPGSHFTWVKMGETASLAGLSLALRDADSVARSVVAPDDPNRRPALCLESFTVEKARYLGRRGPFELQFNPWLNTLIGGRGTGKSTLLEFLRVALRRDGELPAALGSDARRFRTVYHKANSPNGLLTADTAFKLIYRSHGARFLLQWSQTGDSPALQEWREGAWQPAEGDIAQRFPVRIFSQKQLFQLSSEPSGLLKHLDEALGTEREEWVRRCEAETRRFRDLRAQARDLQSAAQKLPEHRGKLEDLKRRLQLFEQAGHAQILRRFQRGQSQLQAVARWEQGWAELPTSMEALAQRIVPPPLQGRADANETERELLTLSESVRAELWAVSQVIQAQAQRVSALWQRWQSERDRSSWREEIQAAEADFERLKASAGDPSEYGRLVQEAQLVEQRVRECSEKETQLTSVRAQAAASLETLEALYRERGEQRRALLQQILAGLPNLRIEVKPFGDLESLEQALRRCLKREDGSFGRYFSADEAGSWMSAYRENPGEEGLKALKQRLLAELNGQSVITDRRVFGNCTPETPDELALVFPEDGLALSMSADGRNFQPLSAGSPGQRTAALLSFFLSYGEEPLILDQPEDDLDNRLIYGLIVKQVRQAKKRRQLILVTHNANIVVNGDAELIVSLKVAGGQTQKVEGCLGDDATLKDTCEILEGGKEALERRYLRQERA